MASKDEDREHLFKRAISLLQNKSAKEGEFSSLGRDFNAWGEKHSVKPVKKVLKRYESVHKAAEAESTCAPMFITHVGTGPNRQILVCSLEKDFGGGEDGKGCLYNCY